MGRGAIGSVFDCTAQPHINTQQAGTDLERGEVMSRQRRPQASGGNATFIALSILRLRADLLSALPLPSQALAEGMEPASCCFPMPLAASVEQ